MDIHAGLLHAILENPADDFPRLVLADWLEEHGELEQAEFIRLQCALADDPHESALCNVTGPCNACRRQLARERRERELLTALGPSASVFARKRG